MPLNQPQNGIDKQALVEIVSDLTVQTQSKLDHIRAQGSSVSIGDMFDMQMIMNRLSQMSEMVTSVMSGMNSAILSMARNMAR